MHYEEFLIKELHVFAVPTLEPDGEKPRKHEPESVAGYLVISIENRVIHDARLAAPLDNGTYPQLHYIGAADEYFRDYLGEMVLRLKTGRTISLPAALSADNFVSTMTAKAKNAPFLCADDFLDRDIQALGWTERVFNSFEGATSTYIEKHSNNIPGAADYYYFQFPTTEATWEFANLVMSVKKRYYTEGDNVPPLWRGLPESAMIGFDDEDL